MSQESCFKCLLQNPVVSSPLWLQPIREQALTAIHAAKFPFLSHDEWRFTDLTALFQYDFCIDKTVPKLTLTDIQKWLIPDTVRLVFINGYYVPDLSDLTLADSNVIVSPLRDCFENDAVTEHLAQSTVFADDVFVGLNTSYFVNGVLVKISCTMDIAIHILQIATKCDAPNVIYPRNLILMDLGSKATIIEDYVGLEDGVYLSIGVTETIVHENAHLQHVRIQRESKNAFHFGYSTVHLHHNSIYHSTAVAFGARLSRYTLHLVQHQEGAEAHLNGLTLINGRQIADTHTKVLHSAGHGKSIQLHKCIVDDVAHAIFAGKIIVHKGAVGTYSEQNSRNLILSPKAHIDTQPQLEIFNDDVRCTHGATVGQLDSEALFFLQSRGLNQDVAKNLLTYAFAREIIHKISLPTVVKLLSQICEF